ncbi:MAG: hypothetical protein WA728_10600 [Xanthobacteraceae bacterium]
MGHKIFQQKTIIRWGAAVIGFAAFGAVVLYFATGSLLYLLHNTS